MMDLLDLGSGWGSVHRQALMSRPSMTSSRRTPRQEMCDFAHGLKPGFHLG
jgi:cyclopropane fatty-acyl-phospholipid synthase-like methyltransferase